MSLIDYAIMSGSSIATPAAVQPTYGPSLVERVFRSARTVQLLEQFHHRYAMNLELTREWLSRSENEWRHVERQRQRERARQDSLAYSQLLAEFYNPSLGIPYLPEPPATKPPIKAATLPPAEPNIRTLLF